MNKIGVLMLALAAALVSGSTAAQILQNIDDKIVGKPSQDQVAAARAKVTDAAQAALSALYAISRVPAAVVEVRCRTLSS